MCDVRVRASAFDINTAFRNELYSSARHLSRSQCSGIKRICAQSGILPGHSTITYCRVGGHFFALNFASKGSQI
eukprot:scaffold10755_cov116-Cylindrotheca_fusiformis.AAC.2